MQFWRCQQILRRYVNVVDDEKSLVRKKVDGCCTDLFVCPRAQVFRARTNLASLLVRQEQYQECIELLLDQGLFEFQYQKGSLGHILAKAVPIGCEALCALNRYQDASSLALFFVDKLPTTRARMKLRAILYDIYFIM